MRVLVGLAALGLFLLGSGTQPADAAPRPGFGWPLPGTPQVERGFTPPATAYGPGHRGVDLSASWGGPVLSAGPGRVSYAGLLAGRGVVTVTHAGGLRTTYEPVDAVVQVGEAVVHGTVLGRLALGHSSCRRLVCLHWGLLRGSVYLDPLSLIVGGPVRLLPVLAGSRLAAEVPLSGLRRMRTLVPVPARPAGATRSRAVLTGVLSATIAVAAGSLLGLMAIRRQDARGRSLAPSIRPAPTPSRPPSPSPSPPPSRSSRASAGPPVRAP